MLKMKRGKYSVGVDIEEIERFRKLDFKSNKQFYKRIFTGAEIDYCLKKPKPHQHFCARFAAKEAIIKAVNKIDMLDFKQIQILNEKDGAPHIELINYDGKLLSRDFKLSLSHNNINAVAFVIYEDGNFRRKG